MHTLLAGRLAAAQQHALACFNVLRRHVVNSPRCGCHLGESTSFPHFIINPACLLGANAFEEYEIATRRVRALKEFQTNPPKGEPHYVP